MFTASLPGWCPMPDSAHGAAKYGAGLAGRWPARSPPTALGCRCGPMVVETNLAANLNVIRGAALRAVLNDGSPVHSPCRTTTCCRRSPSQQPMRFWPTALRPSACGLRASICRRLSS